MPSNSFRSRLLCLAVVLAGIVLIIPLLLCDPLPLQDYPAHLARMYVLAHIGQSATLAHYYQLRWAVLPNLAMDLIVPSLMRVMPLRWAGVVMVGIAVLGLPLSALLLSRRLFGRISPAALVAFLMAYNRTLLWGFVNYEFGLVAAFFAFTGWIDVRRLASGIRAFYLLLCAMLIFFCHFAAFGVFCILVTSYEVYELWARRPLQLREACSALIWLLPLMLAGSLILLGPTKDQVHDSSFGSLASRATGLLDVVFQYNLRLDVLTFVLVVGVLLLAIRMGVARIAPHAYFALAALFFFYLVIPFAFLSALAVGKRLIIAFFLLAVAALDFTPPPRYRSAFAAGLVILFLLRMAYLDWNWVRADVKYRQAEAVMLEIPPGQRVAPFVLLHSYPHLQNPPFAWIASELVWRREDFVPIFAEVGQQPLSYRRPGAPLSGSKFLTLDVARHQTVLDHPFVIFHPEDYDYVLIFGRSGFPQKLPEYMRLVREANDVAVLKIDQAAVFSLSASHPTQKP